MSKLHCAALAHLLHAHGVRNVVLCPGSRNAPIIMAIERSGLYETRVVIDERSAAFIAMGMAVVSGQPTAVVCTSGTALLNFAPAAAEAYYRQAPLILISADRPRQWIDQDDSQTLRQPGALHNFIRFEADIAEPHTPEEEWYAQRAINDACLAAIGNPIPGPVHLNVQINEPINEVYQGTFAPRVFRQPRPDTTYQCDELRHQLRDARLMVVAGFMPYSPQNRTIADALAGQCALLVEAQSNLCTADSHPQAVTRIDATLRVLRGNTQAYPDVVITMGGALLSRHLKHFLRQCPPTTRHIHVGYGDVSVDCFKHLTHSVRMRPADFFGQLTDGGRLQLGTDKAFIELWDQAQRQADAIDARYFAQLPWSDFDAMRLLVESLPTGADLQVSNGTSVRYLQLFDYAAAHAIYCNRGVSGIDGSTSTALGGAFVSPERLTVLITGDMSAQYDMGALATEGIPPTFRMAVISNSGGGIFRFIGTTRDLDECERNFCGPVRLPLRQLAEGFGFDYLEAHDQPSLQLALRQFYSPEAQRPIILNVVTPPQQSAQVLIDYFHLK